MEVRVRDSKNHPARKRLPDRSAHFAGLAAKGYTFRWQATAASSCALGKDWKKAARIERNGEMITWSLGKQLAAKAEEEDSTDGSDD